MLVVGRHGRGQAHRSKSALVGQMAFGIGMVASVAASIAAAEPSLGARIVAAWPAVALLLIVEMLTRAQSAGSNDHRRSDTAQPTVSDTASASPRARCHWQVNPWDIGDITRAALVLLHIEHARDPHDHHPSARRLLGIAHCVAAHRTLRVDLG
ncbi:hypothetical protein AB0H28_28890 [Micromonospora sp. NPDC050980]|uniref:hypothetical protein n=1 Tax=Micromonospora sp. NPDC050980 TaxID=3155161 RepID=UPI00340EEA5F